MVMVMVVVSCTSRHGAVVYGGCACRLIDRSVITKDIGSSRFTPLRTCVIFLPFFARGCADDRTTSCQRIPAGITEWIRSVAPIHTCPQGINFRGTGNGRLYLPSKPFDSLNAWIPIACYCVIVFPRRKKRFLTDRR